MSDFESFRRDAGSQVVPPDFDELVATSRRRRRTAAVSAVVAVAAVVGVVAVGLQGFPDRQSAPVAPATQSPSTTTPTKDTSRPPNESQKRLTPSEIVNDPDSHIEAVAISDSSSDVKAVAWTYCGDRRFCNPEPRFAVTVTGDNFATSHDVALPGRFWPILVAVGSDSFYASSGQQGRLISADGQVSAVRMESDPRPLAEDEVFVGQAANMSRVYLAVDLSRSVAHPLPLPAFGEAPDSLLQNTDGTLVGVVYRDSGDVPSRDVVWSGDGGASWEQHQLTEGNRDLVNVVPSTSSEPVLAVVEGGDNPAFFPFETVHRSTDGGATWQTFDETAGNPGDVAYVGWSLVKPDGSLLVNIEAWSDIRRGHPSSHPVGLYQSNGEDWADMRSVQDLPSSSYPSDRSIISDLALADYAPTPSGVLRLWIYDSWHARLFESGPGIDTWAEVPAR